MINLDAKNKPQELVKKYLEENATEALIEKINNGVPVEKDGKHLINKKTLDGFMSFATSEARKISEPHANSACIEDSIVFGWAMHYFEEDSIEGTLFNEDGTPYSPPTKKSTKTYTPPAITTVPKKSQPDQMSLFDFTEQEEVAPAVEEKPEPAQKKTGEQGSTFYSQYMNVQCENPDCLLFTRIGDFYEAFGDSATKMAKELDLTLTSREVGLKERVPMCGVPYHAFDNYVNRLVEKGYKVAYTDDDPLYPKIISPDDIDDDLTEEEMQAFDGDIEMPEIDEDGVISSSDETVLDEIWTIFKNNVEVIL